MAKKKKTLAMRVLEGQQAPYEVVEYPPAIHDAVELAAHAGLPADHVYKTLVVEEDAPGARPLLVMIAGPDHLDLKKAARHIGAKKARMARHADAERMTGLQTGGISALALLNRGFRIFLDESARDLDYIVVSAGQRGLNLKLAVDDLLRVTGAAWIDARE